MIELIRNQKYEEAIKFAQDQINGDQNDGIQIEELEKTLTLLAFDKPETSPYSDLMQPAHRNQLATRINEAILKDQFGDDEAHTPKLVSVIKLFLSTQNELDSKKISYQKIVDPFDCKFENKHWQLVPSSYIFVSLFILTFVFFSLSHFFASIKTSRLLILITIHN